MNITKLKTVKPKGSRPPVLPNDYLKAEELASLRDGWIRLHHSGGTPCADPQAVVVGAEG
jgi:hypothetical protein